MKKKTNFIVQGSVLALAGIISKIIGIARRFPMEHIIGDVGNGYYSVAYEIYSIMLLISCYSLPLAVSKVMSAKISKKQYQNANRVFQCAMVFALISGSITFLLVELFNTQFAAAFQEPMSAMALRVLGPAMLIVAVMGVFRGYFQGMGTMIPTAVSQILEQIFVMIATIIGAYYLSQAGEKAGAILHNPNFAPAYGAAGASLGPVIGALIGLVFLSLIFVAYSPTRKKLMRQDVSGELDSYGSIFRLIILTILPVLLSTTVYNVSNIIDIKLFNSIMVKKGLDDMKAFYLGVYSGKYRVLVNVPIALANAMCSSIVPVLAGLTAKKALRQEKCQKITSAMQFTMFIAIPSAVGLAILAKPIISLLFNGEVDLAVSLLHFGSISVVFYSMSTLTNGALQGINKMRLPVIHALIALAVHVVFLIGCLEMNLGVISLVYANVLFSLIVCVLNSIALFRHLGYHQELKKTFVIPLISSAIMGAVLLGISAGLTGLLGELSKKLMSFIIVVVAVCVGVLVYFVSMIMLKGITEKELKAMPGGRTILGFAKKIKLM